MYSLSEKIDYLKACDLFETIPYDEVKIIAFTSSEICCPEGDILFEEGDEAFDAYVIFEGAVEIFKKLPDGREVILRVIEKNDIFGEYAIISQCPRSASARVSKKFSGIRINRENFLDILREFPEVSIGIMDVLVKRLVKSEKKLLELMK